MCQIDLLCWKGYGDILAHYAEEIKEECGADVCIHERGNADEIFSCFHVESYDIVVADYEYRELYRGLVLELPQWAWRGNQYLEPFQERGLWELEGRICFVPIRFGTNGLIYRRGLGELPSSFRDLLNLGGGHRVGIWNWWLPNLLLLAKVQFPDRRPDTLSSREIERLGDGVIREFISTVRRGWAQRGIAKPVYFNNLGDIVKYTIEPQVEQRKTEWILGPSEMVVAPASRYAERVRAEPVFGWGIPEEGGLLWVEAAALSRRLEGDPRRLDAALKFLGFLQSEKIQAALICGEEGIHGQEWRHEPTTVPSGHWSYALNNAAAIDRVPMYIRRAFQNENLVRSVSAFSRWLAERLRRRQLVFRSIPSNMRPWEALWDNIIDGCGLRATP